MSVGTAKMTPSLDNKVRCRLDHKVRIKSLSKQFGGLCGLVAGIWGSIPGMINLEYKLSAIYCYLGVQGCCILLTLQV